MTECWIDSDRALPGTMSRKNLHDHRTQFQIARKQIWTSDGRVSNTFTKKSYAPQTNIDLTNSKQICYCSNKQIQQRKKLAQLLFNFQMTQTFVGGCRKQRRHTMAMDSGTRNLPKPTRVKYHVWNKQASTLTKTQTKRVDMLKNEKAKGRACDSAKLWASAELILIWFRKETQQENSHIIT